MGGIADLHHCQTDVVSVDVSPKSPWKTSAASPAKGADSDSWPALSEAKERPKINVNMCSDSVKSPPSHQEEVDGCRVAAQAKVEQLKSNGRGNYRYPRKPHGVYHNKTGPKQGPGGALPIPIPIPVPTPIGYYRTVPPVFNVRLPMPPISASGYAYQVSHGSYPRADTQILKPGSDAPAQEFIPPVNGGFHPLPYIDSSAIDSDSFRRNPRLKDRGGHLNPPWNNQRPVAYYNTNLQQTMGPRPFVSPPFLGPSGFVNLPYLSGHPGFTSSFPAAPPGSVRVPYHPYSFPYLYPVKPGVPKPPAPTMSLRASIVAQIEYYFSDENLQTDHYLISLMDGEGWVPISVIAGFPRIRKMKVEIPFILNALLSSETIEVQGEKIRKQNTWSKWVPCFAISDSSSHVSSSEKNDELNNETDEFHSINKSSGDYLSFPADSRKESVVAETKRHCDEPYVSGETQNLTLGNSNLGIGLDFKPENEDTFSEDSNHPKFSAISQKNDSVKFIVLENCEEKETSVLSNLDTNDIDGSTDDFSSKLMLVEDLDLELKRSRDCHPSTLVRSEDVNDQVIERLVIVTQELNSKQLPHWDSKICNKSRDDNSRYTPDDAPLNSKTLDCSAREINCDSVNFNNQWKQNEECFKQLSMKQRLLPGNLRYHGSDQNSLGMLSESPPSETVGFYFSPPSDSNELRDSKLCASSCKELSGTRTPDGSVPKSFPPFRHPNYKLLEENHFKQQIYKEYHQCCLTERKNLGIGCSEEMNKLYRFWSYFLRDMFIPSMYNEFQTVALEDAAAGCNYGMEYLFRFYSYGLEKEFRENLYESFEQLTLDFYRKGNLYGLKKYWEFHHYRKDHGQTELLKIHPELERLLRDEFHTLDDFPTAEDQSGVIRAIDITIPAQLLSFCGCNQLAK